MATQSLYRRYRPRRFSEVKGQDHVVRALRSAVINNREGQAYLFSGPRGTGKTTSARILAKVLNCARQVDGEPCCECESCLAVEQGTSYDVHELDAASNNGVDAMRDLIEKASLGTPGRHKVYILDEVHMLSKQAEAALLKTLEEPPPHVVFVLATTDPQKVSETIRSRTQHLRFHLLPIDELEAHVRWVAHDSGLDVDEAAIQTVLEQGGGSARDTLSALELIAAMGGDQADSVDLGEFVEALIADDPGHVLTAVAAAVQRGRDPRSLTEDLVRHLRDCFLMLMAPELVALPEQRAGEAADQASRLGAARLVRAMERLGEMLVEMRHAPDPRLLLEVALVQLAHPRVAGDMSALIARVERLEQGALAAPPPAAAASPVDPATGRAQLGGRARAAAKPTPPPAPTTTTPSPTAQTEAAGDDAPAVTPRTGRARPAKPAPDAADSAGSAVPAPLQPSAGGDQAAAAERAAAAWTTEIVPSLKTLPRAMYSVPKLLGVRDGALTLAFADDGMRRRCEEHRADVEGAIAAAVGARVPVVLVVDGAAARADQHDNVVAMPAPQPPPDDEVDLSDLVDAPPADVVTPVDRIRQVFPGAELVDDSR